MKATFRFFYGLPVSLCLFVAILSVMGCNRYDEIVAVGRPVIEFDHPDGIYTVVVGETLLIAPTVENAVNARYEWMLEDSTIVCTRPEWESRWSQPGQYYVILTVTADGGVAREEIMIDVVDPQPPAISLAIPDAGLMLARGTQRDIAALFGNCGSDGPSFIEWQCNGEPVGHESNYCFKAEIPGIYNMVLIARNSVGESRRDFVVQVVDHLPSSLRFLPLSYLQSSSKRYTVAGRPIALQLVGEWNGEISWTVDGQTSDVKAPMLVFESSQTGSHTITAENGGSIAVAEVIVMDEPSRKSAASVSSEVKVFEYVPAPGQFIGETNSVGGMSEPILTPESACRWAESRLALSRFVSLGSWGGYMVCGLDGSIVAKSDGDYDFAIMGNAISTSNEPGIVWVMQDVNGNGLPDDEWYELKGSEFVASSNGRACSVCYFRPAGPRMSVQWTDSNGCSGVVEYLPGEHPQSSYYPQWVDASNYTLFGTMLESKTVYDASTGMWDSPPFDWGYVDNLGANLIAGGDTVSGLGQWTGFRISDAVLPDGTPVRLSHIDFIKIQTGAMASAGRLGELSTEVCSLRSL